MDLLSFMLLHKGENKIGIKLYKIHNKKFTRIGEQGECVNLYALLDLCISAASTRSKAVHIKEFDRTFPEIKIEIGEFTKKTYTTVRLKKLQKDATAQCAL